MMNLLNKLVSSIKVVVQVCKIFCIEPNLIALLTFLQSNHNKWSINGKTHNQGFKWYLTRWIQTHINACVLCIQWEQNKFPFYRINKVELNWTEQSIKSCCVTFLKGEIWLTSIYFIFHFKDFTWRLYHIGKVLHTSCPLCLTDLELFISGRIYAYKIQVRQSYT